MRSQLFHVNLVALSTAVVVASLLKHISYKVWINHQIIVFEMCLSQYMYCARDSRSHDYHEEKSCSYTKTMVFYHMACFIPADVPGSPPFTVSPEAVIAVARPLVFQNSIVDVHLANVTLVTKQSALDCMFAETTVSISIVVRQSGSL